MEDSELGNAISTLVAVVIVGYGIYFLYQHFIVPPPATLEQQRMCSEQADKLFKQDGYTDVDSRKTDRFNTAKNACFTLISTTAFAADPSVGYSTSERLYDAFTGELIGTFFEHADAGKPPSVACTIFATKDKDVPCQTEKDWTRWTATYIQPLTEPD